MDPLVPQLLSDAVLQPVSEQQPLGQELESQETHVPLMQVLPEPQAAPLPHRQAPEELQLLALLASQAMHAAPPNPQ